MSSDRKYDYRGELHGNHLDFLYDDRRLELQLPDNLIEAVRLGADGVRNVLERLREQLPEPLPAGTLLLQIPPDWGSFTISTPHPVSLLRDPLLLCRELELNAPDLPAAYHLDYAGDAEGSQIFALRSAVVEFLRELFIRLDLELTTISFADQQGELRICQLSRCRSWSELLSESRQQASDKQRNLRWLWLVLLLLPLLAAGGIWFWSYLKTEPPPLAPVPFPEENVTLLESPDTLTVSAEGSILQDPEPTVNPEAEVETLPDRLADYLLDAVSLDSLNYLAVIPGWITWRNREGRYGSRHFSCDMEVRPFQLQQQRLLSDSRLLELLSGNELNSAVKIVILRQEDQFNLLWYY